MLRRHKLLEHPDPWIATAIAAGATTETVAEIHAVAAMTTAVAAVTLEEEVEVTTTTTGIATIHATEVGVDLVVAAVAVERGIHETEGGIHEIATRGLAGVEMAQGCREEMEETQGALAVATTASAVTAVTATVSQRAPVAEGDATAPRTGDRHRGATAPRTETGGGGSRDGTFSACRGSSARRHEDCGGASRKSAHKWVKAGLGTWDAAPTGSSFRAASPPGTMSTRSCRRRQAQAPLRARHAHREPGQAPHRPRRCGAGRCCRHRRSAHAGGGGTARGQSVERGLSNSPGPRRIRMLSSAPTCVVSNTPPN